MVETRRDGFTLIELLIVIMLISILAGIAQRAYQRLAVGAEIAAVASECRNLYTMFEIYNVTTGSYPYASSSPNKEFWLTMTMARNPTIRFVVASSDNAPLAGGEWLEGVYIYQNGELSQRFGLGQ
jgi:prepilin-type N-terminal cleavage/methylation domain-containing protein